MCLPEAAGRVSDAEGKGACPRVGHQTGLHVMSAEWGGGGGAAGMGAGVATFPASSNMQLSCSRVRR